MAKGRKVYVEGRLQTRSWEGKDGVKRTTTEIVIFSMIILDSKRGASEDGFDYPDKGVPESKEAPVDQGGEQGAKAKKATKKDKDSTVTKETENEDEIPF